MVAFEKQDQEHPPQPGGVVFVGSSSIRLWKLDEEFPGKGYVNRGFGGSEMADSVHFFDRIVLPHRPRMIVLYAGDNDLAKGKTACRVAEDFAAFVKHMHEVLPETKLVYVAVKPSLKRWNIVHHGRAANALIEAACIDDELLTYLDISTPMLGPDGKPRPELFADDGLHLNSKGYELWTSLLVPHLK
jgi:lysophospholipase L1-like esterase